MTEAASPTRTTVLVVDDHFLFAQALAGMIKDMPRFELVGIAVTGPQTIAIARESQPDVVLLDYHLPGYSADTLMPRLAVAAPNAKIIVLTSDTSEAALMNSLQAGAVGFMTKDKAIDDVIDALDAVAAGTSLISARQRELAGLTAAPAAPARAPEPVRAEPTRAPEPVRSTPIPRTPAPDAAAPAVDLEAIVSGRARSLPARPLDVRLVGIRSFAEAVQVERQIDHLAISRSVYIRGLDVREAAFRVALAEGATSDALARQIIAGAPRLRLARLDAASIELQVEASVASG